MEDSNALLAEIAADIAAIARAVGDCSDHRAVEAQLPKIAEAKERIIRAEALMFAMVFRKAA